MPSKARPTRSLGKAPTPGKSPAHHASLAFSCLSWEGGFPSCNRGRGTFRKTRWSPKATSRTCYTSILTGLLPQRLCTHTQKHFRARSSPRTGGPSLARPSFPPPVPEAGSRPPAKGRYSSTPLSTVPAIELPRKGTLKYREAPSVPEEEKAGLTEIRDHVLRFQSALHRPAKGNRSIRVPFLHRCSTIFRRERIPFPWSHLGYRK
jgi:hypothetical protein